MQTQHDPDTNTIAIEGLAQPLSILHVTDSHMALADERDPEALPHADHYGALFRERTPDGEYRGGPMSYITYGLGTVPVLHAKL